MYKKIKNKTFLKIIAITIFNYLVSDNIIDKNI